MRQTHGMSGTPTYVVWRNMIDRCTNPKIWCFHRYGGRGITVCNSWIDFSNFLADMGPKPEGMTLDRIDNDGNYEPGNCRWATKADQMRNSSRSKPITFRGETKNIKDWAEHFGVSPKAVYSRLKSGWTFEEAITTPAREVRR